MTARERRAVVTCALVMFGALALALHHGEGWWSVVWAYLAVCFTTVEPYEQVEP